MRLLFLTLAWALTCSELGASTQARSYEVSSFEAFIRVLPNAELEIREELTFDFKGGFQGIYRLIPVQYPSRFGSFHIHVRVHSATDETGRPLNYKTRRVGRNIEIKIWVPGAQDAERKVVLEYRVLRALLLDFPDHDELYWNVTGNEWGISMKSVSAYVTLPQGVPLGNIRASAFTGPVGSQTSEARIDRSGELTGFIVKRSLRPGEGLTLVLGWSKGYVRKPSFLRVLWWRFYDYTPFLLLPLLTLGICFLLWRRYGQDPRLTRSVMPLYEPPKSLSVAEQGVLVDDSADLRDISATIVDLAVRGHLKIREEISKGLLYNGRDYLLEKLQGPPETFTPFEKELLHALFGSDKGRRLSDLENQFYTELPKLRKLLYEGLIFKGCYISSPEFVRNAWRAAGAIVFVIGALFLFLWTDCLGWGFSGMASGGIIFFFASIMPAKVARGIHALWEVLGFQEFLSRAEKDRIEREPELFHRYLPHAMALGVTNLWVKAFQGLAVAAPAWYISSDPFEPQYFHRRLDVLDRQMASVFASSPRSEGGSSAWSGGSGLSGGSSGGGFGGGGGGAF